jgi:hypothetical protein
MAMTSTKKECIMDIEQFDSEVIDLGVASAETKGSLSIMDDDEGGLQASLRPQRRLIVRPAPSEGAGIRPLEQLCAVTPQPISLLI